MQRNISISAEDAGSAKLPDIAAGAWALMVTVLFIARILGLPTEEEPVRLYLYPSVMAASAIGAIILVVRRVRGNI